MDSNQIDKDLNIPFQETNSKKNMQWSKSDSVQSAIKDCHAIIILTEWEEFQKIPWKSIIKKMKRPAWIFDTRSVVDVSMAEQAGFNVWQIGNYTN